MFLRYWHTLKHLKRKQLTGRLWFRFAPISADTSPPPPRRKFAAAPLLAPPRAASMTGPNRFLLLNEEREIVHASDWSSPKIPKLWRYQLHYFDDLRADDAAARADWHRALIDRWITQNRPIRGDGWEPYPISLRIVNWVMWIVGGNKPADSMVESMAVQARFLYRRIETHLMGNHLLANAKGLIAAGLFFEGDEAIVWRRTGERLMELQLAEQILPDGGHFERSPMYHAIITTDLLDLFNLYAASGRKVPDTWSSVLERMLCWLAAMQHPDGEISLFNDAAIGVAPAPEEIFRYAERLGLQPPVAGENGITQLSESGYARMQLGGGTIFCDAAPLGPDYLPAHGHADTLAFEMSIGGRRIIVNSGTSLYEPSAERLRQRGTAAHNTLMIDGKDSSEVWSSFRVARRAHPLHISTGQENGILIFEGAHDGYCRLRGVGIHRRRFLLDAHSLTIIDDVDGSGSHDIEVAFHLHPDWRVTGEQVFVISCAGSEGGEVRLKLDPAMEPGVTESSYHPSFGLSIPNRRISGRWSGQLPASFTTVIEWDADRAN